MKGVLRDILPALHSAYGLHLAATFPLPGLPILPKLGDKPDVRIRLKERPAPFGDFSLGASDLIYTSPHHNANGKPGLTVGMLTGDQYFGFAYSDGARFAVERQGREVWADWPDDYALEDAATYLMGPVLGFVLRLRGVIPLHASAVVLGEHAVAFVGSAHAGKSTTAAAFARLGHPVLSDDVVPLVRGEPSFMVQPGYPRVNLWPDSVRLLFGSEDALPRVTPTWDKRFLNLDQSGYHFEGRSKPLGAIYVLSEREEDLVSPVFEDLEGWSALQTLVVNTYVNYLLDSNMRQREFHALSQLVGNVPIRRVRPAAASSCPFDLCTAIVANVKMTSAPVVSALERF